ncbi:uncharacterized protein TNCV_1045471 [Trichonephila clavipes]|nr:uncharacterized protein TNCV_1045471 [Trichonephila clavipes]
MGNVDMTCDIPHNGYRNCSLPDPAQSSCWLVFQYFSLTFLYAHDEGSVVRRSIVQACKGVARSSRPGVTLSVQSMSGSFIAISGPLRQMHIFELSVRVNFHPTTTLSTGLLILGWQRLRSEVLKDGHSGQPVDRVEKHLLVSLHGYPLRKVILVLRYPAS